jgi:hypothetical protein
MTELRYRRLGPRRWVWFARRDGRWELERPRERMELEERRRVAELLEEFNEEPESGRGEESRRGP